MILTVLSHPWKMLDDRYAQALQLSLIANARKHQHFGRVHRAQRQNNLKPSRDPFDFSIKSDLHTGGSLPFEGKLGNQCVREHSQVWPVHVREDISSKRGQALSIAYAQIDDRGSAIAFH